jgi:hypothetical protein
MWIGVLLIRLRRLLAGTQQEQRRAIHALGEKLKRSENPPHSSAPACAPRPGSAHKMDPW